MEVADENEHVRASVCGNSLGYISSLVEGHWSYTIWRSILFILLNIYFYKPSVLKSFAKHIKHLKWDQNTQTVFYEVALICYRTIFVQVKCPRCHFEILHKSRNSFFKLYLFLYFLTPSKGVMSHKEMWTWLHAGYIIVTHTDDSSYQLKVNVMLYELHLTIV